jgi:hypothetical protein
MAIDNFIPEIWAAGVTSAFTANQVVIPTLTQTYSGEARKGNTVHIIGATTPTIVDYAAAGRTIDAEALADTEVTLLIDQERAFSVNIDDVDAVQAAGSFDAWVMSAGAALGEDAEKAVLAGMISGAGVNLNTGSGAVVVDTPDEAKAAIRAIRLALTKAKVPVADRFVAVNPAMADLLIAGLSDVAAAGAAGELRNGQITRLYGLNVLETPLFAEATKPVAVGYHSSTVAFVSQIDKVESLRNPSKFSDIVRGLNVFGTKVTRAAGVVKYLSA